MPKSIMQTKKNTISNRHYDFLCERKEKVTKNKIKQIKIFDGKSDGQMKRLKVKKKGRKKHR